MDAGAHYLADETTVIDERGMVQLYPRELKVRGAAGGRFRVRAPVEGNRALSAEPIRVAGVIQATYIAGGEWAPMDLSRGQCVLALLENSVRARQRTGEAFRTLGKACAGARGLRSDRGEAATLAHELLRQYSAPGALSA
jgi:hypothetical protein